jgi:endogenous inhibitor of DNA gyrase (YacG/DUF329 family)
MVTVVKCPTCRRPVQWSTESVYRPFCSDRCRLIDLGAWFGEQHRIPDESANASEDLPPASPEES